MLNFAVVEDDNGVAEQMAGHLQAYCDAHGLTAKVTHFESAFLFLEDYKPIFDIVFMDIMLPGLNGLDASKMLREVDGSVLLIFVTNMANFAIKGYEVGAFDFIVKPVVYDTLVMKMDRALKVVGERGGAEIRLNADGEIRLVPAAAIRYVEVSRHYLVYHTDRGNFRVRGTIERAAKELAQSNFARCNISYLVNLKHVAKIRGDSVFVAGDELKISRARKKEFLNALTNYLGRTI